MRPKAVVPLYLPMVLTANWPVDSFDASSTEIAKLLPPPWVVVTPEMIIDSTIPTAVMIP